MGIHADEEAAGPATTTFPKHREPTGDHDVSAASRDERMRVLFYGGRAGSVRVVTRFPAAITTAWFWSAVAGRALARGPLAPGRLGYQITPSARWVTSTIRSGSSMSSTGWVPSAR